MNDYGIQKKNNYQTFSWNLPISFIHCNCVLSDIFLMVKSLGNKRTEPGSKFLKGTASCKHRYDKLAHLKVTKGESGKPCYVQKAKGRWEKVSGCGLLFVFFLLLTLDFVTVKYSSVVYVANEALHNYLFIFVRQYLFLFWSKEII